MTEVTINGKVTGKLAPFRTGTAVNVGDLFSFTLAYDTDQSTLSQQIVNGGEVYSVVSQPTIKALLTWSGTMPSEIVQFNAPDSSGNVAGWGSKQSWFHPSTVLKSEQWSISSGSFSSSLDRRGFEIQMITNFNGTLGYGWWAVGSEVNGAVSPNTIDYGFFNVTSITVMTPVPEPAVWKELLVGLISLSLTLTVTRRSRYLAVNSQ